jgi:CubicO group peptidase (beta-lactamase class C family)
MKNKIILLGFIFNAALSNAQTLKINEAKIQSIDSLFRVTFRPSEPGAIVILAKDGKTIFNSAYGLSNVELNVQLNTDMKMGIGSISKQFASISILLLQQEKKVNIKDDIRKYLPQYNTWGRKITIENILSHTSGIPSYTELPGFDSLYNKKVPINKLVKVFEKHELIFEPGTNWSYSNSGYVLAALIVERLSGMNFNSFVYEKIFRKLLMGESTFGESEFIILNKTGEYGQNTPKGKLKMDGQYNWYWAYGAGQIISTVQDMLKWDEGLYDSTFIRRDLLSLAHKSIVLTDGSPANYGLGWAVEPFQNKTMIQHGGSIGGYRSHGMRIPEDHLYFLVLSNSAQTNSSLLSNKVLSILYDIPGIEELNNKKQEWKEIEGVYESPSSGLRLQNNYGNKKAYYTIKVDSANRITAQRSNAAPLTLIPGGKDLLFEKSNPFSGWKLIRNQKGGIESIAFTHFFPGYGPIRLNKKISDSIPKTKIPTKTDSAMLMKYIGVYEIENKDVVFIEQKKNELFMYDPTFGTRIQLNWIKENEFWIKETNTDFLFIKDEFGKIIGTTYSNGFEDIHLIKVYNQTK